MYLKPAAKTFVYRWKQGKRKRIRKRLKTQRAKSLLQQSITNKQLEIRAAHYENGNSLLSWFPSLNYVCCERGETRDKSF